MSQSRAQQTISEAIIEDHAELEEYYGKYQRAANDVERNQWANQFRWELARHSVGEELCLYPLMEKYMGERGQALVAEDRKDHLVAKEQLYQLERMDVSDPEFDTLFSTLMKDLREHIRSEEDKDLVEFEKVVPREESEALAKSFSRTKMFVPTRSHPGAPDKGGIPETVAGLLAAPIDHLKDLFSSFPAAS